MRHGAMRAIRRFYDVPAKRGMTITYDGIPVRIVAADRVSMHLIVRRTDVEGARTFRIHPTWRVTYPKTETPA